MYKATLFVPGNPDELEELFAPELKRTKGDRATVSAKKTDKGLMFTVEAKDSVAMRAQFLGITKLLTIKETAEDI